MFSAKLLKKMELIVKINYLKIRLLNENINFSSHFENVFFGIRKKII